MANIAEKKRQAKMDYGQVFSENLSNVVDKFGWSQTEFGRRLGVSQVQAGRYLAGKSSPPFDVLSRLEQVTGIPAADFFRSGKRIEPRIERSSVSNEIRETIHEAIQQGSHGLLEEFVKKVFPVVAELQKNQPSGELVVKKAPIDELEAFINRLLKEPGVSPDFYTLLDEGADDETLSIHFLRDLIQGIMDGGGPHAEALNEFILEYATKQKGK